MFIFASSSVLPLWTVVFFGIIDHCKPDQLKMKQLISSDQEADCTVECSPAQGNKVYESCMYDCVLKSATFFTKEQRRPTTPSSGQPQSTETQAGKSTSTTSESKLHVSNTKATSDFSHPTTLMANKTTTQIPNKSTKPEVKSNASTPGTT
uniref:Kazal-like domain-containing protein n=1 Tax=Graphocephala atropunctata TaxID=36148 RepID=A0A1B6KI80_9HEMI